MKVLLIEDELHSAGRLESLLMKYDPGIKIAGILSSVRESIEWFSYNPSPDLIFQDIQLNDGDCFEIYSTIKVNTPVIFTTAYSEYAIRSFELNSIDYLVKPYDFADLKKAMEKFRSFSSLFLSTDISLLKELQNSGSSAFRKRILIQIGDQFKAIPVNDVAYILSEESLSIIYLASGRHFPVDKSIASLSKELNPDDFFRINRKCIVHSASIKKISKWFNGRLKLELSPKPEDDSIVSRERVKAFKQWLDK